MYIYIIWGCKDFPEHKKRKKKKKNLETDKGNCIHSNFIKLKFTCK